MILRHRSLDVPLGVECAWPAFIDQRSSGQPLRMLVDLRAAVDDALQGGGARKGSARAATASPKSPAGIK